MFTRFAVLACSILLLSACEEAPKESSRQSVCKGLGREDCTAKTECNWNAKKVKCKDKEESEQAVPPEQSAQPAPSGPSSAPEGPDGASPQ